MRISLALSLGAVVLVLASCERKPVPPGEYAQSPQPATYQHDPCDASLNPLECYQWRDAGGSVSDYLAGAMAGYMVTTAMHGGYPRQIIVPRPGYRGPSYPIGDYDWQVQNYERDTIARQQRQIERLRAQRDEARRTASSAPTYRAPAAPPRPANDRDYSGSSYRAPETTARREAPAYRPETVARRETPPPRKLDIPSSRSLGLATGGSSSSGGSSSTRSISTTPSPSSSPRSLSIPSSRSLGLSSSSAGAARTAR